MVFNLQQDAHDIFQDAFYLSPHNPQLSYFSKQAEVKTWILEQNFVDNITVTGKKIILLSRGDVCGRKRKNDHC